MSGSQNIREKTFEKAMFGATLGSVDDFLENVAAKYAALPKALSTRF
jgi:cell division septum initiation protein DivIVA